MSHLLAIESATSALSVALFQHQNLVEEIFLEPDGRGHSEKLLPLIDRLLSNHHLKIADISRVALSAGPGSYTSLRVGAATVLGLCEPTNIPVVPVSTLTALATHFKTPCPSGQRRVAEGGGPPPRAEVLSTVGGDEDRTRQTVIERGFEMGSLVCPVLKAGRGRVYAAVYEVGDWPRPVIEDAVFLPTDLVSRLNGLNRELIFVGPGVELIEPVKNFTLLPSLFPRASSVGLLALTGQIPAVPANEIHLRYLQEPDLGLKTP